MSTSKLLPILFLLLSLSAQASTPSRWKLGIVVPKEDVALYGPEAYFSIDTISDALLHRMQAGGSYPKGCQMKRSDLRYLKLLHVDYHGATVCGEMVCNKAIAHDLYDIFLELYRNAYPIERMVLIDNYGADDEQSMSHNNTSSFCYRTVAGTQVLSKHAQGLAVDINTQHNPCVKYDANGHITKIQPNTAVAKEYAKRSPRKAHMIDRTDLCYRLFTQHGFTWGGSWRRTKDYQHFEK